mmetsp:Transcript_4381/g.12429  ORF Transcript_4381/g.12429 Transcript_4381/m.12429 type:complete len:271 (-) Transcript_4381:1395-2207(-)
MTPIGRPNRLVANLLHRCAGPRFWRRRVQPRLANLGDLRRDEERTLVMHAHIVGLQLLIHGPRELVDVGLASRIDAQQRHRRKDPVGTTKVHHHAATTRLHPRKHGFRQHRRRIAVDMDQVPVEFCRGCLEVVWVIQTHPGVVHQDTHVLALDQRLKLGQLLVSHLGQIHRVRRHLHLASDRVGYLLLDGVQLGLRSRNEHDVQPTLRELQRIRLPDAVRGTRDDRRLPILPQVLPGTQKVDKDEIHDCQQDPQSDQRDGDDAQQHHVVR